MEDIVDKIKESIKEMKLEILNCEDELADLIEKYQIDNNITLEDEE